jgi:MSHA biogenesis protein MshG
VTTFHYRARQAGGEVLRGEMEAASARDVATQLAGSGATPLEISEAGAVARAAVRAAQPRRSLPWGARVSLVELVMLCRQLYTLTRAGVPMIRSLEGLAETARNPLLGEALGDVAESVRSGRELTTALERHPKIFPQLFVNTLNVGETTGRLEESFSDLAGYLEREEETIKKIRSALRYPMLVLGAVVIAVVIINIFVVPAFSKMFVNFGGQLPLPTRILIGTSDFFLATWPYMLVGVIGALISVRRWLDTEHGRYVWDRYKLRMPIVGPVIERATLARFARGFSMASRSGIDVIESLRTIGRGVDNSYVCERVGRIADRISRGEALTPAAAASGLFTPLILQMISVGEETGAVDDLLQEVAEFYEREVEHDLKRLADSIEPIMIVGMGSMVLVLALAVYMPMWEMASMAKGG